MKKSIVTLIAATGIASWALAGNQSHDIQTPVGSMPDFTNCTRSFSNGWASRVAGNIFDVQSHSLDARATQMDQQFDGGDGPCKGQIIGLTAAESKARASTVVHTGT